MNTSKEERQFEKLGRKIYPQSKLLRTWNLTGGFSTQMTAFEVVLPNGQTKKMIRRCWQDDPASFLKPDWHLANEFKLLQLLESYGLAAPKPCYLDESDEIFSTPYIVFEYIEANSVFARTIPDYMLQLATQLAKIHGCGASTEALSFLPQQTDRIATLVQRQSPLDESLKEAYIRNTLKAIWPLPQHNESVLLHGDFWPGNTLSKDGQVVAVIDWDLAALGDPLSDLAYSRLNILWEFGHDAMHSFTTHYKAIMNTLDFSNLPYWELCAAALHPAYKLAEWYEEQSTVKTMRAELSWFITQAFEKIED